MWKKNPGEIKTDKKVSGSTTSFNVCNLKIQKEKCEKMFPLYTTVKCLKECMNML